MSTISKATLVMDRTTKGAVRYQNVKNDEGQAMTTVYLRKSAMIEPYPGEIVVTIETPELGRETHPEVKKA